MKTFIVILIIVLAAVGAYWFFSDQEADIPQDGGVENGIMEDDNDSMMDNGGEAMDDGGDVMMDDGGDAMDNGGNTGTDTPGNGQAAPETVTIRFDGSGYIPSSITISQGDSVTWVNDSATPTWPASAQHPTHTVYPGSGIELCNSGADIFDACRGLNQGESFTFQFNETGSWNFHDHLNPTIFGRVVVE